MKDDKHPVAREEELSIRLTLAQAWVDLWRKAYDALLHHGVNLRGTKEWQDTALLDEAMAAKNIREGQGSIIEYLKRAENGLMAAIRRKGMKQVH